MYEIGPFSHWTLFKGFWKYSCIFLWPLGFSPPYSSPPALCRGRVEGIASLTSPGLWLLGPASGGQETRGQSRAKWTNASPPAPAACKLFRRLASFSPHSAPTQPPSGSPLFPQSLLGLWLVSLLHLLSPPGWGELSVPRCYRPWVLPSPSYLLSYLSHDLVWPLLNFAQITLWVSHLFPVRTSPEEEAKLSNPSFHPLTFPALTPQTVIPPRSPWHSPTTSSPSPAHPGLWLWSSPLSGEPAFSSPHTQILLSFQDAWRVPPLHDSTTEDLAIISGLPSAWATVWIKQSIMAMSYKLTHHPLISDSLHNKSISTLQ